MTDKKPPQSRKLVSQKVGAVDKRRRPRGLTRAIRTAIDAVVFDRCSREEACKKAGITERALYLALEKAEVASYWNSSVVMLRTGEKARNVHVLTEVRDSSGNAMARVAAVKTIEQLIETEAPASTSHSRQPGVVIQIIQQAPSQHQRQPGAMIDVTPNEPSEHDRH
jgi:hypothetical protein